jgi:uncharacterized protein YceH (UPF0502 family)
MNEQLDEIEVRVLGSLIEKEVTTPDYYPLSLNALLNACNQKSNREPVVSYDDDTVSEALDRLRHKGLVYERTGGDSRVPKYLHRVQEVFNFDRREQAVMCVLMLRGPQTVGELRERTQRMYGFDDLPAVESCLNRLMEKALVKKLSRQTGYKEPRFAHLLSGDVAEVAAPAPPPPVDRFSRLEAEIEALRREIEGLKQEFAEFRKQFE